MQIRYLSIPEELQKMDMSQRQFAKLLGITPSTLNHRIKKDSPTLHWCLYGVQCFYGKEKF
jgi:predicted transcriptional regulator